MHAPASRSSSGFTQRGSDVHLTPFRVRMRNVGDEAHNDADEEGGRSHPPQENHE
jgi:hypothetical protein